MFKNLSSKTAISISLFVLSAAYADAQIAGGSVVSGNLDVGATATPGKLKVVGQTGSSAIPSLEVTGDGGVVFQGTYGTGVIPTTSTGSLLMWYPKKMAFRAGYVSGSQWQDAYVGDGSMVLGYDSIASGVSSMAFGTNNNASGEDSFTLGANNDATGAGTISIGDGNYASGVNSLALGFGATTNGQYSIATGYYTTAQAKNQFVVGSMNIAQGSASSWVATDDLFVVGNGVSTNSNAFTVKKNGVVSLFGTEGATTAAIVLDPTTASPSITVGGQKVVTADSSGSLSIGARNPTVPTNRKAIEINAGGYGAPAAYNTASNGDKLILYRDGTGNYDATIGVGSSADMWFKSSGTGGGMFRWYTGSSVTNSMVLDMNGNLGVGTSAPTSRLDVKGNFLLDGGSSSTYQTIKGGNLESFLNFSNTAMGTGNKYWRAGIRASAGTGGSFVIDKIDDGGTSLVGTALAINGNGNVGIGTTSPSVHLKVGAGTGAEAIAINGGTGNGEGAGLGIEQNGVTIGSIGNTARLIGGGTSQAFRMQAQNSNNIEIVTYNANPILFATGNTERMRVDASGNLGVGTTSPTAKLEVAGTVKFAKQGDIPMGEFGLNGD